jgi:2-polyprenyl-3-methyl-5-hydroxy-6-metoxy-1,4-benzoquinol methylase
MISKIEDSLRLFTAEQADKQKYMHTREKWEWGRNTDYFFPWHNNIPVKLDNIISDLNPNSVLDYGCGQGLALKKLSEQFPNINFYNYDAFVEEHSTYPVIPCDLIVSNNVLHHIEDEFYDQAVENLYGLCKQIILIKLYLFENYKTADWYEKKYSKLFKIDSMSIGDPLEQEVEKSYFLYGVKSHTRTPLYLRLSK